MATSTQVGRNWDEFCRYHTGMGFVLEHDTRANAIRVRWKTGEPTLIPVADLRSAETWSQALDAAYARHVAETPHLVLATLGFGSVVPETERGHVYTVHDLVI